MPNLEQFLIDNALWIALGVVATVILFVLWRGYNRLAALDERCDTAMSDVDALLKHRHDLLPSLVESVRAFASHEGNVLTEVTRARASALQATRSDIRMEAETQLGHSINSLLSVVEKYPELQAGSHFAQLRADLNDTQNRITAARRFYNLAVNEFNSTRRQFPVNVVGALTRLARRKSFDVGAQQREVFEQPIAFKL